MGKGKLIVHTVLAVLWNVACLITLWFFTQGIITSIALDMAPFAWLWGAIDAVAAFLLALNIRFCICLRKRWRQLLKGC